MITQFRKKELRALAKKLTDADREKALQMAEGGKTFKAILLAFGVDFSHLSWGKDANGIAMNILFPEAKEAAARRRRARAKTDRYQEVYDRYQAGEKLVDLYREYNISPTLFTRWRRRNGLMTQKRRASRYTKKIGFSVKPEGKRRPTPRKCLRCGRIFEDTVNHLCPVCRGAISGCYTEEDWGGGRILM